MDEITKGWLEILSARHPQFAVSVSHQFLSGTNRNEAGFVPNDWNGIRIEYNSLPKGLK